MNQLSVEKLREDFNNTYNGGYVFSEVEDVITWTIQYVIDDILKNIIKFESNHPENRR